MALVGACFSIAFTFGPALGAWLAGLATVKQNPFAVAAGFSLFLIVTETIYLYLYLPETLPDAQKSSTNGHPIESKTAKAKEQAFAAAEPVLLLLLAHVYTGKIGLQQVAHQTAGTELGLQEYNQVSSGKENASAKYRGGWPQANGLVEGVETGGGQDETADVGHI